MAFIPRECVTGAPHLTVDQGADSSWNWNLQRPALSDLLQPAGLHLLKIPQSPTIATSWRTGIQSISQWDSSHNTCSDKLWRVLAASIYCLEHLVITQECMPELVPSFSSTYKWLQPDKIIVSCKPPWALLMHLILTLTAIECWLFPLWLWLIRAYVSLLLPRISRGDITICCQTGKQIKIHNIKNSF